ncbi:hypothetical protein San01_16910 [Streptomyces angustmyceticus]|uniref:Uncharacterized protein n=1 Tax=Streptomyces angustmyceticus TaxID=285578 RepID=A0A5J4L970_9ACTN|nr:hypothetical protein San01_16910 [Streptomyces angustmyceticus]
MRYGLCTFVVMPKRWLDAYGWRRLSAHEEQAVAVCYRTLGRRMGITGLPQTYEDFELRTRHLPHHRPHGKLPAAARRGHHAATEVRD